MLKRLILLTLCLFCTGCSALPKEERAFAVALGMEKAEVWRVYGRFPAYQSGGKYLTVSGEGGSLSAALADMNASAPMETSLSQLRLAVLGEHVPLDEVLDVLGGQLDVRQQCALAVTQEGLPEVMEAMTLQTGQRLSKSIDLMLESRAAQGRILCTTLAEAARMGVRQSPVLALLTLTDGGIDLSGAWAGEALSPPEAALLSLLLEEADTLQLPLADGEIRVEDAQARVCLEDIAHARAVVTFRMAEAPAATLEQELAQACAELLAALSHRGWDALGLGRQAACMGIDMQAWPVYLRSLRWSVAVRISGPA